MRALVVANGMLEQDLADVSAKASRGYLRGRRAPKREESPLAAADAEPSPESRQRGPE